MLTELRIKNFAIIESLTLPLARGFNVLSGETGAGKSIIVGALGLLLGERASADLIRTGAERATVEGVFDVADRPEITALLDERGIDAEEPLVVLKREIAAAGRTRAWVNGTTVERNDPRGSGPASSSNLHGAALARRRRCSKVTHSDARRSSIIDRVRRVVLPAQVRRRAVKVACGARHGASRDRRPVAPS